jgi:hypothetical protein
MQGEGCREQKAESSKTKQKIFEISRTRYVSQDLSSRTPIRDLTKGQIGPVDTS